ncbi:hypothetical protein Trydic_g15887 [Trypoxylus dichotomus]
MARVRMVRWAWIVLAGLCALASSETQQQCPPRIEISPCSCTVKKNGLDILCEYTDQQHISNAMAALKGKSFVIFYLKLRQNVLRKLPGFVFLGLDIRHLTIYNSSLSVVEEASLSSIGKMLTQLDVSQNSLTSVPSTAYKNLHQLLVLNMNYNKINSLHSRAFEGLDTLEILTLYENKITTVDQEAFVGLEKKLKRLNLGGNGLTSVPQKSLSILDMLRKLEMQENKISEIREGDFEGLKNLDSLGLAHNKLKVVPARVFSHLTLLNSLELDGNSIYHIDPEAFYGLEENLQYLRLGDNNIHTIPTEALRRLHRLRHLDLRSNNISSIADDAFTGFGDSITFLNLQKNDIKTLPPMAFDNLNSLETLSLQNNKLMHIPEEIMEPVVDTLKIIDIMEAGKLTDIEEEAFNSSPFSNLRELLIQNNPIVYLRKNSFIGLKGLENFSFRMRSMTEVHFEVNFLQHMKTIAILQIHGCILSSEAIMNITGSNVSLSKLQNVDFRFNLIEDLQADVFARLYAVLLFNINDSGIETVDLNAFRGLFALQSLNLSNNNLATLPEGVLDSLMNLRTLYVHDNPWHCDNRICWLRDLFTKGGVIDVKQPPRCANYNNEVFSDVNFCLDDPEPTQPENEEDSSETAIGDSESEEYKKIICRNWGLSPIDFKVNSADEIFTQEIQTASEMFLFRIYDPDVEPVQLIVNITGDTTNFHLLWFNTHDINETGCVTNLNESIILDELRRSNTYTFCMLYYNETTVSPHDCFGFQIRVELGQRAWIRNKYSRLVTSLAIIFFLLAIIASALLMYCCVRKYPVLIKGNKSVIIVGKRKPEESAKPYENRPPSFDSILSSNAQSYGYTRIRRRRYRSPMLRSLSEHSVFSNEVSYIRPTGPTNYQLNTWRLYGKGRQRYVEAFEGSVYGPNPPPLPPPNNIHLTWDENLYTTL